MIISYVTWFLYLEKQVTVALGKKQLISQKYIYGLFFLQYRFFYIFSYIHTEEPLLLLYIFQMCFNHPFVFVHTAFVHLKHFVLISLFCA